MENRLILIEGLPGAGKSTIGQFIWLQAMKNNIKTEYIGEREQDHPLETQYDDLAVDVEKYIEESLEKWRSFVERVFSEDITFILDSCILQQPLNCLIFADEPYEKIICYIKTLSAIIEKLNPLLIYLGQEDVNKAILSAGQLKGTNWEKCVTAILSNIAFARNRNLEGQAAVMKFFSYRQSIEKDLLARLPFDQVIIDVTKPDYRDCRAIICKQLHLEHYDLALKEGIDLSLTGDYRNPEQNVTLHITNGGDYLLIDGFKLLWKEKNTYYMEGTASELVFLKNNHGDGSMIQVGGKQLDYFFPIGTIFKRVV